MLTALANRIRDLYCASTVLCCYAVLAASAAAADDSEQSKLIAEQTMLLEQHNVATDTPGLVAYLRSLSPDAKPEAEIAKWIAQLGDGEFSVREAADKRLQSMGEAARRALVAVQDSPDAEVLWRANQLLRELNSGWQAELSRTLLLAALLLLEDRRSRTAAETILATLPLCDEPHLADAACEALWASVDRSHADALNKTIEHDNAMVVAAAIVASDACG